MTAVVEERVQKLLQIRLNFCNWSWLLNLNCPPISLNDQMAKEEAGSTSVVRMTMEEGAEVSIALPPGEVLQGEDPNINLRCTRSV